MGNQVFEPKMDEIDRLGQKLAQQCGWLVKPCGRWWNEFVRGVDFFIKCHPDLKAEDIVLRLNGNRKAILDTVDFFTKKIDKNPANCFRENMRPYLTALSASAAIIGPVYHMDPLALMAFVSKECPKDSARLDKTFKRMMGPLQLSPGNTAREFARGSKDPRVRYDINLLQGHLSMQGINPDMEKFREQGMRFIASNPLANMLGATFTLSLIMKRRGIKTVDALIKQGRWKWIAHDYNGSQNAMYYARTYMDNYNRMRNTVEFNGWQPPVVAERSEKTGVKRRVYAKIDDSTI